MEYDCAHLIQVSSERTNSNVVLKSPHDILKQQRHTEMALHHRQDGIIVLHTVRNVDVNPLLFKCLKRSTVPSLVKQDQRFP